MSLANPTPWHPDKDDYIRDANGKIVYLGSHNSAFIVAAVNAYAAQHRAEDGLTWKSETFMVGNMESLVTWLNAINAITFQWWRDDTLTYVVAGVRREPAE